MTHAAGIGRLVADRVRVLSLVEQGLLSAANLGALLAFGRAFSATDFGTFSFAWLTVQFVLNLHRSVVVVPFVIHTAQPGILEAEAPAWRRLNAWTTGLATAALMGGAAGVAVVAPGWMAEALVLAALFVVPVFTYEFSRRWLIQTDHFGAAVITAALYCALQIVAVGAALVTGDLWVGAAGFALAGIGAAGFSLWKSPRMAPPASPPAFVPFLRRLSHFIGWSLMSNLAYNGYSHMPPLILGIMAGPVPVAVFTAIRNFTQPLNTVATAIDNFDKPRAARAFAANGTPGLRRALTHTTGAMAAFTLPYLALLLLAGDGAVAMIYGDRYGDPTTVLAWFTAIHAASLLVYPVETALFLLRRPDLLFAGRMASAATGIGLCLVLVPHWGLAGAMAGMTGGIATSGLAALYLLERKKPWTQLRPSPP